MNNQVLSVEQMQELIDIGIDTSSASCIWWNFADLGFALMFLNDGRESLTIEKMKKNHGAENIVPAFTFQDILEILPENITTDCGVFKQVNFSLQMHYGLLEYSTSKLGLHTEIVPKRETSSLLQAAFNMLKWVKQNNYI